MNVVQWVKCRTVPSKEASSNSSRAIKSTFELMTFENTPYPFLAMGKIVSLQFFYKHVFRIKLPSKGWYAIKLKKKTKLNLKLGYLKFHMEHTIVAERTSYVWRVNYFDIWSRHIISPNGDNESHSARTTFPGIANSVKARQTTSSLKSIRQDGRISVRSFISSDSIPWW